MLQVIVSLISSKLIQNSIYGRQCHKICSPMKRGKLLPQNAQDSIQIIIDDQRLKGSTNHAIYMI